MSTETTKTIDVTPDTTGVCIVPDTDITTSGDICVDTVDSSVTVEGYKKEYSIVGDGIYASISSEEAPTWLTTIIDDVVSNAVANGMLDYDLLVQDVRSAIDALDIAQNTYVEKITFASDVDTIIGTHLETLNATLGTTYATIVNLDTVVADANFSLAQSVTDLRSEYQGYTDARITEVQTALTNATSAQAADITALESAYGDQGEVLSGTAEAVSGLQTYVGLDSSNNPNGTGMLNTISSVSTAFTNLENGVTGPAGDIAYSLSNLQQTSQAYANEVAAGVENKFEYNSTVTLNGVTQTSGFGIVNYLSSVSGAPPQGSSEFWVDANRFVLKNPDYPNISAAFTVTSSGITLGLDYTEATRNIPRGTYAAGTTYYLGDVVTYNGSSYTALSTTTGNAPTDATYWQVLASVGLNGRSVEYWFKRSDTEPTDTPNTDGSDANGWYTDLSNTNLATTGDLWVLKGTKEGSATTWTFGTPVVNNKRYVKELVIYSDATTGTVSAPTNSTYSFSEGSLTINDANWNSFVPPITANNQKIYVASALVSGNETESSVTVTWNTPGVYAQRTDGVDGVSPDALTVDVSKVGGTTTLSFSDGTTATIDDGIDGDDATSYGVKPIYADDAAGTNASFTQGTRYYVNYYEWSGSAPTSVPSGLTYVKYKGEDGDSQGVIPIYANDAAGSGASFTFSNQDYVNFYEWTGSAPTSVPSGLTYVKFVGDKGDPGDSVTGPRGTAVLTYAADLGNIAPGSVTSTNLASYWNTVASTEFDVEKTGDTLIVTNTSTSYGWTHIFEYNGSIWTAYNTQVINGNQVVEGTLAAEAIGTGILKTTNLTESNGDPSVYTTAASDSYTGTVIDNNGVRVYNAGVLRVKLGKLT